MDLILWRHAQAELLSPEISDSSRHLTPKGLRQANKMAYWLNANLSHHCRILVSPAVRTLETMAALASLDRKFKVCEELAPDATAEQVLKIANWPNNREPVMIVGHQPYLGQVAAQVLAPASAPPLSTIEIIGHQAPIQSISEHAIRKGNVWWITQKQVHETEMQTYLKAIMSPDLVTR